MKPITLISALLLLANWSLISCYQCPDTLISGIQTYECNTVSPSRLFDSTSFNIPSGQTTLTISFDIKVTSLCNVSSPQHLVVATVGSKKFMDFMIDTDNTPTITTQTTLGTEELIYYQETSFPINKWITMAATLDTIAETFGGAVAGPTMVTAGVSVDPITRMIKPDSTMKISVCSDVGGTNRIACQMSNLKLIYNTFATDLLLQLVLGSEPVLVGLYKFKEGTGYSTNSSISTLGTAYFGASNSSTQDLINSPAWVNSEQALSFTATTQYVTLPTFSLAASNNRANTVSLSVHFWFKATATPSHSGDTIFTYTAADLTTNRISLMITDAMDMQINIGTETVAGITPVTFTLSTWVEVIARIIIMDDLPNGETYFSLNFGNTETLMGAFSSPTVLTSDFKSTDVVRIGGFVGQIADLRIFTPGAFLVNTASCTSGCAFDLGTTNPATCFAPDCGAGSFASSCLTCPSSCTSCSANNVCRTCPAGSGLSRGACNVCPADTSAASFTSPCKGATVLRNDGGDGGAGTTITETSSNASESISVGAIIGIAVGAAVGVIVLAVLSYVCIIKKIIRKSNVGTKPPDGTPRLGINQLKVEVYYT